MKRIIKFRGKDIKTGQFIFGDLETRPKEDFMVIHQYHEDGSYKSQVKVDPETVGQFTGLLDKNGREIYEGDLFRYEGDLFSLDGTMIMVVYEPENGYYCLRMSDSEYFMLPLDRRFTDYYEVISNIYDHPELLKTEE
jgi:uncharacterized phage protein (TIGR01671 family)